MKKIILLFASVIVLVGCDSQLEQDPPSTLSQSSVFSNAQGANAAVRGVYDAVRGGSYYGNFHISLVENHTGYSIGRGSQNPMSLFDLDASNRQRMGSSIWEPAYEAINRANNVVGGIEDADVQGLSTTEANQFLGEARALRALNYFNLVRLFGGRDGKGVPLRIEPSISGNLSAPRASQDSVYNLITSDLQFAANNLPDSYSGDNRGRVTSWGAKALLSKVHLTRENWSAAETLADEIIDSGEFELVVPDDTSAEFEQIFGNDAQAGVTNNEVIWEIQFAPPEVGNDIGLFLHAPAVDYYPGGFFAWFGNIDICRLEEAFDKPLNQPQDCGPPSGIENESFIGPWHEQRDVDRRANHTLYDPKRESDRGLMSPEFPMFFRKHRTPNVAPGGNPMPIMRYAEIIYIKSEAEFRQNGANVEALEHLNMMRRRARGLDPATPSSAADVAQSLSGRAFLDTLLLERAKEFVMEQKRYYDLKRTTKNGELRAFWLAKELGKGTPELRNFYWPLPQEEIDNNDALTQEDQNQDW